jgi:uncharacterized paraquat-inducible protein A
LQDYFASSKQAAVDPMSETDVTHSEIICPKCAVKNSITVNAVNRNSRINCSRCGNNLGVWNALGPKAGGRHTTSARIIWSRDRTKD